MKLFGEFYWGRVSTEYSAPGDTVNEKWFYNKDHRSTFLGGFTKKTEDGKEMDYWSTDVCSCLTTSMQLEVDEVKLSDALTQLIRGIDSISQSINAGLALVEDPYAGYRLDKTEVSPDEVIAALKANDEETCGLKVSEETDGKITSVMYQTSGGLRFGWRIEDAKVCLIVVHPWLATATPQTSTLYARLSAKGWKLTFDRNTVDSEPDMYHKGTTPEPEFTDEELDSLCAEMEA